MNGPLLATVDALATGVLLLTLAVCGAIALRLALDAHRRGIARVRAAQRRERARAGRSWSVPPQRSTTPDDDDRRWWTP